MKQEAVVIAKKVKPFTELALLVVPESDRHRVHMGEQFSDTVLHGCKLGEALQMLEGMLNGEEVPYTSERLEFTSKPPGFYQVYHISGVISVMKAGGIMERLAAEYAKPEAPT